ncbi:MAG TPA: sigma-70 family RNA polymerase sigma factor, partial [Rhodothermales bacterium]|nr:sigma-70 family RNA polymerase sigma factor [Rhodothermales bacterium]
MSSSPQVTVTQLLAELRDGHQSYFNELLPLVYDELHVLAHQQRRRWHGDYTVNTTALVHEAYLKLVDQTTADYKSRAHFYAVAAQAMRYILIDYAKKRRAQKRGGDVPKVSFDEMKGLLGETIKLSDERVEMLVILDEALEHLAQVDERLSRIVECRFFGEMTIKETADALDISTATVKRSWTTAQAWLYREI